MSHVVDALMKSGELRRGRFSHIANSERKKPARKWQSSGALDRVNCFSGVFLTKNTRRFVSAKIQFRQLLDLYLEQIHWFAHQPSFDQFVSDDAAHTFDVERAARRQKLDAPCGLRWAMQILAAPRDEFRVAPNGTAAHRTFAVNVSCKIKRLRITRPF